MRQSGTVEPAVQVKVSKRHANWLSRELDRLDEHLSFLATVVNESYVDIWDGMGIMNSFMSLGNTKQATLAHARGCREAWLATAIGLFAAILPSLLITVFPRAWNRLTGRYELFVEICGVIQTGRQANE